MCLCSIASDSNIHGIFQARVLEWVAIFYSRGSSPPRDETHISCISYFGRWILYQLHDLRSPHNWTSIPSPFSSKFFSQIHVIYNYLDPWLYQKNTHNLKVEIHDLFDRHSEGFKPLRQYSQVTLRGGSKEARGEPGYIRVFATKVM